MIPSDPVLAAADPPESTIAQILDVLENSAYPVLVVGDRAGEEMAARSAVRLAETLGMRVYTAGYAKMLFPTSHPQYMGLLSLRNPGVRRDLQRSDAVLALGTGAFKDFFYQSSPILAEEARLILVDIAADEFGRSEGAQTAVLADPAATLERLAVAAETGISGTTLEAARQRRREITDETNQARYLVEQGLRSQWDDSPMSPWRMMAELEQSLPSDVVLVDDAISSRPALHGAMKFSEPGSIQASIGQAIGWGMGAALGVKLARPDRPVVSVLGDGSAMMTVQALWTAAVRRIPVVYVICNNGMYRILKLNMNTYLQQSVDARDQGSRYIGMDFPRPFDFAAISEAFGVHATRIDAASEIAPAVESALASGEPTLLDVIIDGSV